MATRWSAERVFPDDLRDDPTFLTGEHVYPWMFEDYGALRPLAEAAQILAEHEWPRPLRRRRGSRENDVPAAAAIYAEDIYVEREFSEQTAARIRGLRPWLTNEYEHDGLRANGERVLGRLIDLVQGVPKVPLLELRNVTRRFGGIVALDDVSFEVARRARSSG